MITPPPDNKQVSPGKKVMVSSNDSFPCKHMLPFLIGISSICASLPSVQDDDPQIPVYHYRAVFHSGTNSFIFGDFYRVCHNHLKQPPQKKGETPTSPRDLLPFNLLGLIFPWKKVLMVDPVLTSTQGSLMKDFHLALGHEAIASTTKLARFKRAKPKTSWRPFGWLGMPWE